MSRHHLSVRLILNSNLNQSLNPLLNLCLSLLPNPYLSLHLFPYRNPRPKLCPNLLPSLFLSPLLNPYLRLTSISLYPSPIPALYLSLRRICLLDQGHLNPARH